MNPMERIRREVFGISQMAMAEIAAVNQATVCRWESGTSNPGRVQMQRIRDYAKRQGIRWSDKWFFEAAA